MVLTSARALAGGKVRRIESSRWVVSIRMSTKTYSTRKSWAEVSMGTGREQFRRLYFGRQEGQTVWPRPRSLSSRTSGFKLGVEGCGRREVSIIGLLEAPSWSLGQGPSLLYHHQPFKHPHLGQQHGFQDNEIQRKDRPAEQEG